MNKFRYSIRAAVAVCVALFAVTASATPSVKINKVLPHYPWDNLVDITYTLSDLRQSGDYGLAFIASTTDGSDITAWNAKSKDVTSQVTVPSQTVNGTHTVTWTADTEIFSPAMDLTIKLYDYSATQPNYMIVDLLDPENIEFKDVDDPSEFNTEVYKTTKMVFRRIEPGVYWIGDTAYSSRHDIEVFSDNAAYVGIFPVTLAQYNVLVNGMDNLPNGNLSWSGWNYWALYPLVSVSWNAFYSNFINPLNERNTRGGFQLTPESLWEVACRAGYNDSPWGGYVTTNITDSGAARAAFQPYGWFYYSDYRADGGDGNRRRQQVGLKKPNAWGFYDMLGNVHEWCNDAWAGYPASTEQWYRNAIHDNWPTEKHVCKVLRGGCFNHGEWEVRAAYRTYSDCRNNPGDTVGFRMAWIEP